MGKCIPTMVEVFDRFKMNFSTTNNLDRCIDFDAQCMTVDTHSLMFLKYYNSRTKHAYTVYFWLHCLYI